MITSLPLTSTAAEAGLLQAVKTNPITITLTNNDKTLLFFMYYSSLSKIGILTAAQYYHHCKDKNSVASFRL